MERWSFLSIGRAYKRMYGPRYGLDDNDDERSRYRYRCTQSLGCWHDEKEYRNVSLWSPGWSRGAFTSLCQPLNAQKTHATPAAPDPYDLVSSLKLPHSSEIPPAWAGLKPLPTLKFLTFHTPSVSANTGDTANKIIPLNPACPPPQPSQH